MMSATPRSDVTFLSDGTTCAAWYLPATVDALATDAGRPCVVMANGFGGTRDTGLVTFAEAFATAGIDAFVFDYRGFGASEGLPRQLVSFRRQRADYHAAIAAARHLPDVDPGRIVLWGTSYAGGHVIPVAVGDSRITAAIAMNPAMDGLAALTHGARNNGSRQTLRLISHGLRDGLRGLARLPPHHLAIAGPPGSVAVLTSPGAEDLCLSIAGPTWRNEVCARTVLGVALNRPITFARRIACPLLVQIGEYDSVAPPSAARATALKTRPHCELRAYPIGHFDFYVGEWQQRALDDQLDFLRRHLRPRARPTEPS